MLLAVGDVAGSCDESSIGDKGMSRVFEFGAVEKKVFSCFRRVSVTVRTDGAGYYMI